MVRLKVMTRWIVIAVMLAAGGCGLDGSRWTRDIPDETLHGDVAFSADEREAIERGNVWIAERVGQGPYEIVWDLPHPTDPASVGGRAIVRGCSHPTWSGEGDVSGHVEIAPDEIEASGSTEDLAVIAAHEFGHTRGLGHLPADVPGLMNPSSEHDLMWTAADQAQCVADRVCK